MQKMFEKKMKFKEAVLKTLEDFRFCIVEIVKVFPKLLLGFGFLLFLAIPTFALALVGIFFSQELLLYASTLIIWIIIQLVWGCFWLQVISEMKDWKVKRVG